MVMPGCSGNIKPKPRIGAVRTVTLQSASAIKIEALMTGGKAAASVAWTNKMLGNGFS